MRTLKTALKNKITILGLFITLLLIAVAAFAPWLAPQDPLAQSIINRLEGPSTEHIFGTDRLGRDIFSRVVYASRISLFIGLGAVTFGAVIGVLFGIYATLRGGTVEAVLLYTTDIMMSIPTLLLCLIALLVLGQGLMGVLVAIGVALVPRFARLSRGPTLALLESEYIEAASALGARPFRVAIKHVLPNIIGPIGVMAVLWIATAIRIEASLSFLGFGVQPPTPTWGGMVEEGFKTLIFAPYVSVFPGLAILLVVLGFNLLGDGLRDIFDPRFRG